MDMGGLLQFAGYLVQNIRFNPRFGKSSIIFRTYKWVTQRKLHC